MYAPVPSGGTIIKPETPTINHLWCVWCTYKGDSEPQLNMVGNFIMYEYLSFFFHLLRPFHSSRFEELKFTRAVLEMLSAILLRYLLLGFFAAIRTIECQAPATWPSLPSRIGSWISQKEAIAGEDRQSSIIPSFGERLIRRVKSDVIMI